MTNIHGRLIIALLNDVVVFCGKSVTFSEQKEMVEATTITSNGWSEYRPRKRSFTATVTGLTKVDSTDGELDYFSMIADGTLDQQPFTLESTDEEGNTVTIAGPVFISESNITGNDGAFAEASVTFLGQGNYTIAD